MTPSQQKMLVMALFVMGSTFFALFFLGALMAGAVPGPGGWEAWRVGLLMGTIGVAIEVVIVGIGAGIAFLDI